MRLQQASTKKRHKTRPPHDHAVLAQSHLWADLPWAVLEAWLREYAKVKGKNHCPAIDKVASVAQYLCARQRTRKDLGYPDTRIVQESADQIAQACKISVGTVNDVLHFFQWLGVLPTLENGGPGKPTVRQFLRPQCATLWEVSRNDQRATQRDTAGNAAGYRGERCGTNPTTPGHQVTKNGHRPPADAVAVGPDNFEQSPEERTKAERALQEVRKHWAK